MVSLLNRLATGVFACASLGIGIVQSEAAQPVLATPAGTALLPNVVYVIPYAVSSAPRLAPRAP